MKRKAVFLGLLIVIAGFGPMQAFAQQDEDVRGAFLTTRPKNSGKSQPATWTTKPSRRRPKAVTPTASSGNAVATGPAKTIPPTTPTVAAPRMGLGLTLFMRDSNGLSTRVDPTREFRKGERVRVLLETNVDGYLYIFNTTDDGAPLMIYPDPQLDEAGNYLQSHVPVEIPSSLATEERLRWFTFDAIDGTEKLYFVFTREPLTGVPIEDDLISYCRVNDGKCPWTPDAEVWARIKSEASESAQVTRLKGLGKAQTNAEQQAVSRGIGLNRDDAEPSLIMLTASTSKNMLVATLQLVHKMASLEADEGATPPEVQVEEQPKQ